MNRALLYFLVFIYSITTAQTTSPPKFSSLLPVPVSRDNYNEISRTNSYSAFKPLSYKDCSKAGLEKTIKTLKKNKHSWWGRKFWNENMLEVQGEGYWFNLDPYVDLQMGKDNQLDTYTFNNTRAIHIEGALLNKVGFYSTIMESQGRFAKYFNQYAQSLKPQQAYAVIPGRDISKKFGSSAFDYPLSTGGIIVSPMQFIDISLGFDKHFIGDGYRSLFLSNTGAPYTFIKIDTRFWHIRYTNLWTWQRDVLTPMDQGEAFKRKYTAIHYLDWKATAKLNFGLFESVTWVKTEERGFDVQYLNPVILFRAMEYANGSNGGNAMVGASGKYKLSSDVHFYGQFVLDELTVKYFFNNPGYWANKYGYQLGIHYYDAFKLDNLHLNIEYNNVRPYTYAHARASLPYGQVHQPLAHPWGANFKEFIFRIQYKYGRWFGEGQWTGGIKGFDYEEDNISYGGDIFRSYRDRVSNFDNYTGQGNKGTLQYAYLEAGYLLNPSTGLKIFGSILKRDFSLEEPLAESPTGNTLWINLGVRSDIEDWHFDF